MSIRRKKIVLGILIIGLFCSVTLVFMLLSSQPYFINFKTTQGVKAHVMKSLRITQSTLQDVQSLIDNQMFGQLDCTTQQSLKTISCLALKEQFNWWYYVLNFTFEKDVLVGFDVAEVYRGL